MNDRAKQPGRVVDDQRSTPAGEGVVGGPFGSWRTWRLKRARLRLADERHELEKWGWSYTPSYRAAQERRIEKARVRYLRLGGTDD